MIATDKIEALVQRLQASETTFFHCQWQDGSLRLEFCRTPVDAADPEPLDNGTAAPDAAAPAFLKSPGIGYLRFRHPLETREPLREGDRIEKAQVFAYLQIGEVLTPVSADREGLVTRLIATEGSLVGYGAPLLEVS